jgi:hypothetical protein
MINDSGQEKKDLYKFVFSQYGLLVLLFPFLGCVQGQKYMKLEARQDGRLEEHFYILLRVTRGLCRQWFNPDASNCWCLHSSTLNFA